MADFQTFFSDYHLKKSVTINEIKFTAREIDILACLASLRSTKKISFFLAISPKTVENYIHNIMLKLECHSREHVVDFLESSRSLYFLKEHYLYLGLNSKFEETLKRLSVFTSIRKLTWSLIYLGDDPSHLLLVTSLKDNFMTLGINITTCPQQKEGFSLDYHCKHLKPNEQVIYIMPKDRVEECLSTITHINISKQNTQIIIFANLQENKKNLEGDIFNWIELIKHESYYYALLNILSHFLPDFNLLKECEKFKKYCESYLASLNSLSIARPPPFPFEEGKPIFSKFLQENFTAKSLLLSIGVFCICGSFFFRGNFPSLFKSFSSVNLPKPVDDIRSDLECPASPLLLNHEKLFSQMDNCFKNSSDIQIMALIGMGGAGKTIAARRYARKQKSSIIYELNADTYETLIQSFENLAYRLAYTEKEKLFLKTLSTLKNTFEKEKKVIFFLKDKLKQNPNWFLIVDNYKESKNIRDLIPANASTWGAGKILLITQDSNIQYNNRINYTIPLAALTREQKLALFSQVVNNQENKPLSTPQKERIMSFLEEIPPFPLDIAIAAAYLKITQGSYEEYLYNLNNYSDHFINMEENVLKECGKYDKTRYKIIALALKNLIDSDQLFQEILLFISLVNAKYIPRDLLKAISKINIDNLIYSLKKYFLIIDNPSFSNFISIHKSIQKVILGYFKRSLDLKSKPDKIYPLMESLLTYLDILIKNKDAQQIKETVPHIHALLYHTEIIPPSIRFHIAGKLGILYYHLNYPNLAKSYLKESLLYFNNRKSLQEIKVLAQFLGYLGNVYSNLGNYHKAKLILEESLNTYKKDTKKNYYDYLIMLTYLGSVERHLGHYEKAKKRLEKSLFLYKNHHIQNIRKLYWIKGQLSIVESEMGNYSQAKDLLEEVVSFFKRNLPKDHIDIAWSLKHLGSAYKNLGACSQALVVLEEALAIYRKHFSEEHTYIGWVTGELGSAHRKLGHYDKAEELTKKSLAIYKSNYGDTHNYVARGLRNLSHIYLCKNHLNLAEDFIYQALKINSQNRHIKIYTCFEILSDIFFKRFILAEKERGTVSAQAHKEKALTYLTQALKITEQNPSLLHHSARLREKLKNLH